jgi:hypothetical protein
MFFVDFFVTDPSKLQHLKSVGKVLRDVSGMHTQ